MNRATRSNRIMRLAPDVQVTARFAFEASEFNIATNPKSTPILINSFNRLTYLKRLVDSLQTRGYENLYVIDNASTYQPVLDYYESEGLRVFYLDRNVGYLALWKTTVAAEFVSNYYVYTDSDILPAPECPDDFIAHFTDALARYPKIDKVGFGLKTDDLPDAYAPKASVVQHERQFLAHPVEPGLYFAPIDTTFALYRPGAAGGSWLQCLRTGEPYVARHLPWYEDSACPSGEQEYYRETVLTSTHWTFKDESSVRTQPVHLWGQTVRVLSGRNDPVWNLVSRGEWEPETYDIIDGFVDSTHAYVELGSDAGAFALYAARVAAQVYSIEADDAQRQELTENVLLNDVHNVEVVDVPPATEGEPRYAAAFAALTAAVDTADISLIRLDIEGDEYQLLGDMLGFLRRRRPTLYLTLHPRAHFGITKTRAVDRAAVAVLSLATILGVRWRLRFYNRFCDFCGNGIGLRRLLSMSRSEASLVATDEEWPSLGA